MQMSFVGMLLQAEDRTFTPEKGANAGTRYDWTELQFKEAGKPVFTMKTVAPVKMDAAMFDKMLQWDLEVEPRSANGKPVQFKIANIVGGKVKA